MTEAPPLYAHQEHMAQFALGRSIVLNTSDAGTAKTRGTLEGYMRRRALGSARRLLVLAPLTILECAWGGDIRSFTNLKYAVAHGSPKKIEAAFASNAPIVVTNHDTVKAIVKHLDWLEDFTDLVIDEFTMAKNRTSDRSKATLKVSLEFEHITELSGTPDPNTVLDMWHPCFILDHGKRLGNRFFQFRSQVCNSEQVGPSVDHVKWVDKPGAAESVADALSDITIRYKLEDCLDIPLQGPPRVLRVKLPRKVMDQYVAMQVASVLELSTGKVTAIHAGARIKKMLQIVSGAVYDENGDIHPIHTERYDLVMQLVKERAHSVVAFNWRHEREALTALAKSMNISSAYIDGAVPAKDRTAIVDAFQAGQLQVLFCHPQSAGHGLTLTRATSTIWCSATYNAEHFQQLNRRIYRAGQTKQTETICIAAAGTKEEEVYEKLNGKLARMEDLLNLFADQTKGEAA